jgi:hypothetical protein
MLDSALKLGQDRFLPKSFTFHYSLISLSLAAIYQGWPTRPPSGAALWEATIGNNMSHVLNAKIYLIEVPLGFD